MDPWLKLFLHLNRVLRRLLKPGSSLSAAGSKLSARELYLWFALIAFEEWRVINRNREINLTADVVARFLVACEAFRQEGETRIALALAPRRGSLPKGLLQ